MKEKNQGRKVISEPNADFQKNVFYKDFFSEKGESVSILEKIGISFEKRPKTDNLSDKDRFVFDTYFLVRELDYKLIDLDACLVFINHYPANRTVRRVLSREYYILYHLEFYYINMISLFDRMLKLTNYIFDLGLDNRDVNFNIIIRNKNVDNSVKNALKTLNNAFEKAKIRFTQNNSKHNRKHKESGLDNATKYEMISELKEVFDRKHINAAKFLSNIEYKKFVSKKRKEIESNNRALVGYSNTFLKIIYNKYEERLKGFKE